MTLTQMQPLARLLISGAIVFGVMAAVAGVSSALFTSAPAVAEDNTFTTGSASLLIATDTAGVAGTYGSSIPGASVAGLIPGETTNFKFWLKNDSTDSMLMDLSADLTNFTAPADLDSKLNIKFSCDVKSTTTQDGDSTNKNLNTWSSDAPEALNQGGDATPGRLGPNGPANSTGTDEALCTMIATLDPTSTAQNTTAVFDAVFTGTQVGPSPTPTPTP